MISKRSREKIRHKLSLLPRNIQRLYKEGKCVECSVVVPKMDFAKILGKFTKVKIQYEANSTTKPKPKQVTSPTSKLKSNENGMVHINRRAFNPHPVKEALKEKPKNTYAGPHTLKRNSAAANKPSILKKTSTVNKQSNVLKEINIQKKAPVLKVDSYITKNSEHFKRYGIVFTNPVKKVIDSPSTLIISQMVPSLAKSLLPSDKWSIDYLPKELKDDKVYNQIAAELEDLMYSKKTDLQDQSGTSDKADDFPSILDILNESPANAKDGNLSATNVESNDVEAMLLGKSNPEATSMDVDPDVSTYIAGVTQLTSKDTNPQELADKSIFENPNSPSILDETLQKGIEEHLPNCLPMDVTEEAPVLSIPAKPQHSDDSLEINKKCLTNSGDSKMPSLVTHVVFKKIQDGKCSKTVTCPKSFKYNIEIDGKSVELIGAPRIIYSLEDLQVLLQIVDECNLNSLYVLH